MPDSHGMSLEREKKDVSVVSSKCELIECLWNPNGREALHTGKIQTPPMEDAHASLWHTFLLKHGHSILSMGTLVSQLCCF